MDYLYERVVLVEKLWWTMYNHVKMCKMMMEVDTRGEWRRGTGGGREWWQGHTVRWHCEKCGGTSRDCHMLATIWKTIFWMTFHLWWRNCILTTSGINLWPEKLICALNPKTTSYPISDARSQFSCYAYTRCENGWL
jgi:hypothetical protein